MTPETQAADDYALRRTVVDLPVNEIPWNLQPLDVDPGDEEPLVAVLLESESYRALAQEALHYIHDLTRRCDRLVEERDRLRDEARALRAEILLRDGAVAS
jgi:hypothetical protein